MKEFECCFCQTEKCYNRGCVVKTTDKYVDKIEINCPLGYDKYEFREIAE